VAEVRSGLVTGTTRNLINQSVRRGGGRRRRRRRREEEEEEEWTR